MCLLVCLIGWLVGRVFVVCCLSVRLCDLISVCFVVVSVCSSCVCVCVCVCACVFFLRSCFLCLFVGLCVGLCLSGLFCVCVSISLFVSLFLCLFGCLCVCLRVWFVVRVLSVCLCGCPVARLVVALCVLLFLFVLGWSSVFCWLLLLLWLLSSSPPSVCGLGGLSVVGGLLGLFVCLFCWLVGCLLGCWFASLS